MKYQEVFSEAGYKSIQRQVYLRRYLLMGIGIFVLGMAMVLLAIVPQIFSDLDLRSRLQQEKDHAAQLSDKIDKLHKMLEANNDQTQHHVDLALPSNKPLLSLLTTVNSAAAQAPVGISKINTTPGSLATRSAQTTQTTTDTNSGLIPPSVDGGGSTEDLTPTERKSVKTLDISLVATGTLAQINGFIHSLETSTPLINITKLSLATQDPSADITSPTVLFDAKLQLTTYYFVQSISVAIDDPLPEIGEPEQHFLTDLQNFAFPSETQAQTTIQGGGLNDLFSQVNKQ